MAWLADPESSNIVAKNSQGSSFVLTRLMCQGALSEIPLIEADVLCKDVDADAWLGDEVTCELYKAPGNSRSTERVFTGVVTKVETQSVAEGERYFCYRLSIQPWFALLAYSRSYRVFQEKTTKDIVTSIFDELGFKGQYKIDSMPSSKRQYCLQIDETDLDFIRRLLAEEGVHFSFGKDADSNTLILHDAAKPYDKSSKVSLDHEAAPEGSNELVSRWAVQHRYHAASLELSNYDYAQTKLVKSSAKKSKYSISGNTKLADKRYPEPSVTGVMDDLAKALVDCRRAQMDSNYHLVDGETSSVELFAGGYLEMASHRDTGQHGDYLVVSAEHEFTVLEDGAFNQRCRFVCAPSDHLYYPAFIEKPRLYGMQSAIVSGKTDAEPASDDQGRIRICFHWDTEASGDKTSCWVRVAQSMAGNGYGLQFIPRAGQEVLVSFLDGDPDQPLVTGSLYNSKHKPPYPTTDTTQSGIKTQLKGQSNELRFDDKKDKEQLYLHAAKDMLVEVENDTAEKVTGEKSVEVVKDIKVTTDKGYSLTAKEDIVLTTDANYKLTAKEKITGNGKTITFEADDKLELIVGSSKLVMSSSKIELESGTISLSGSSKIELDGGQVAISGSSKVDVKSSGAVNVKATTDFKAAGLNAEMSGSIGATVKGSAKAELSTSGQAVVKGSIVMIN